MLRIKTVTDNYFKSMYTKIPNEMWGMDFSLQARMLLVYLLRPSEEFVPTMTEVQTATGLSRTIFIKALNELITAGVFSKRDVGVKLKNLAFSDFSEWSPSRVKKTRTRSTVKKPKSNRLTKELDAKTRMLQRIGKVKESSTPEESAWVYAWFYRVTPLMNSDVQDVFTVFHALWGQYPTHPLSQVIDEVYQTCPLHKDMLSTLLNVFEKLKTGTPLLQGHCFRYTTDLFVHFKELTPWLA